jgi:hypothetical protein
MADPIIRLNVAGVHYDTTKSTLCRVSGSMLDRMFNGSIDSTQVDGRYFIDRDGSLFQHILRYLRDTNIWTPPSEVDVCRDLLREAQFFCLEPLIKILETAINEGPDVNQSLINTLESLETTINQIKPVKQPSERQAFAVVVDEAKIYFYDDTPSALVEKFTWWTVNGYLVLTCHKLIQRAKDLGYSLTSSVCIPEEITINDIGIKRVSYSIMLMFESK